MRAPLWQQRKRAADLLAVASRYGSFPVLLETYRECLRDFFDMPALVATLADVRSRKIRVATVDSETPSPFAASLLFSYVASFLYDGDAPLAERRAQALAVDQAQLRELLGDAELRELLDAESMDADRAAAAAARSAVPRARAPTASTTCCCRSAISTDAEIRARVDHASTSPPASTRWSRRGACCRSASPASRASSPSRTRRAYRDALGVPLPPGIPESLLQPVRDPLGDLALRYARTHAPFTAAGLRARATASAPPAAEAVLMRLTGEGRLLEGEFRPGGTRREWTDAGVLRMLRRRSLAKLRHEVEPVDQAVLGRFTTTWQGIVKRRHGADALLDAIEQLQGAPLPASILETEILPARLDVYDPADLDAVTAAGEVVWVGVEPLGERDGRVALYLADHLPRLLPPDGRRPPRGGRATELADARPRSSTRLRAHGASFFGPLHEAVGGGYPGETVDALWNLVWHGLVTNDTFHALRAFTRARAPRRKAKAPAAGRVGVPLAAPRAAVRRRTMGAGALGRAVRRARRRGRSVARSRRQPRPRPRNGRPR